MYTVALEDAGIGQVVAEPVFSNTGVLLCNPGTPVSLSLKSALQKFKVFSITVRPIVDDKFDLKYLNFDSLNNMTVKRLQDIDMNELVTCARTLVSNLTKNKESALLYTLFEYDDNTAQHSVNVAALSATCGIKQGYSARELYLLSLGGLLHDIGKTYVPLEILNKPTMLNAEEREIINKHPEFGLSILQGSDTTFPLAVKQIVLQHHENYDGTGYPRHLKGYHIYKLARLIHIADVYDALCRKRSYKEGYPREYVREYMQEKSRTMFDPQLLDKFLNSIPLYLIGEEIECNGLIGVVVDQANTPNPLISVGRDIVRLSDFMSVRWSRHKVFNDFSELLFR